MMFLFLGLEPEGPAAPLAARVFLTGCPERELGPPDRAAPDFEGSFLHHIRKHKDGFKVGGGGLKFEVIP